MFTAPTIHWKRWSLPTGQCGALAGHNRDKIGKIRASLDAGLNVLADKPWIIRAEDFGELEAALSLASGKNLVAYDMMTERHEIATILQRELVNDPEVFGTLAPPDPENPSVILESTHHILKTVAGSPNPRPPFFFDVHDQGEGLTDVGTHLVDLVQWTLFPEQAIDHRRDIQVQRAKRWPTPITWEQFRQIPARRPSLLSCTLCAWRPTRDDCNGEVDYRIRGAQVRVRVLWNWESPGGRGLSSRRISGNRSNGGSEPVNRERTRSRNWLSFPRSRTAALTLMLRYARA